MKKMLSAMIVTSYFIVYILVMFAKAIRDAIQWGFNQTILTKAPRWLRLFLTDELKDVPVTFDGWHWADGFYLQAPLYLTAFWLNYLVFGVNWILYTPVVVGFVYLFLYQLFNYFRHYFLKLPQYKGKWFLR